MKRWPTKPLGDVGEFVRGISFKPTNLVEAGSAHSLACFRTKNIQTILDDADLIHIPRLFVKTDRQLVQAGDILISTANSNSLVGKCCFVPQLRYPATLGGFIAALRVNKDRVRPRFLYYWLASPSVQERLRGLARQTTNISNLPLRDLAKEPAPIPPLPEQERIVKLLDEADGLRKHRAQADRRTANLIPALFHEMFGDPTINTKKWPLARLGEIAPLKSGFAFKSSDYRAEGVRLIRISNLDGRHLVFDDRTVYLPNSFLIDHEAFQLSAGDVLVAMSGATTGKLGMVRSIDCPSLLNQRVGRFVICDSNQLDSSYLFIALSFPTMIQKLIGEGAGSAQANVSPSGVGSIAIAVPPLVLQKEFAQRVAEIRGMEASQATSRARLDALFQSMLHRAFNGEL